MEDDLHVELLAGFEAALIGADDEAVDGGGFELAIMRFRYFVDDGELVLVDDLERSD